MIADRPVDLPPSLADLPERLAASEVSPARQREIRSAPRTLAAWCQTDLASIPATAAELRQRFAKLHPAKLGVSKGRFANVEPLVVQGHRDGQPAWPAAARVGTTVPAAAGTCAGTAVPAAASRCVRERAVRLGPSLARHGLQVPLRRGDQGGGGPLRPGRAGAEGRAARRRRAEALP